MTPRSSLGPAVLVLAAVLAGCASKPAPLYMWEGFPRQQYDVLRHDGASIPEQIQALEAHAAKAQGAHAALPPGFRAHLAMLKLSVGDVDGGRELLVAEKAAFPESAPYMDQLLKRFETPPADKAVKTTAEANPA
jgi:hypothetical protein